MTDLGCWDPVVYVVVNSGVEGDEDVDGDGRPPKECDTCRAPLPDRHGTFCRACTAKREREQSQRSSARYVKRLRDENARLNALLSTPDPVRLPDGTVVLDVVTANWLHDLARDVLSAVRVVNEFAAEVEAGGQPPEDRWRLALEHETELRNRAARVAREFQTALGPPVRD